MPKLTQHQLALLLGRSRQTVASWGAVKPKYARAFLTLWECAPEDVKKELLGEGRRIRSRHVLARMEEVFETAWTVLNSNPAAEFSTYALAKAVAVRYSKVGLQTIYYEYLPAALDDPEEDLRHCYSDTRRRWSWKFRA